MARETALFTTSGNTQDYPDTPFQVLFADSSKTKVKPVNGGLAVTGRNSFTVSPETPFYVPLLNVTDSPPVVGKFPNNASGAAGYFFGPDQLGVTDTEIIVDGKSTPIGVAYLVGPVKTPLNDGGTHIITLGAFLAPMSEGTHTVEITGELTGQAFQAATGLNFESADFTYVVHVRNQ